VVYFGFDMLEKLLYLNDNENGKCYSEGLLGIVSNECFEKLKST
jgi:hypothetical protein